MCYSESVSIAFPNSIDSKERPPSAPDLNSLDYSVWLILELRTCLKSHNTWILWKKPLQKAWSEFGASYLLATVDPFPTFSIVLQQKKISSKIKVYNCFWGVINIFVNPISKQNQTLVLSADILVTVILVHPVEKNVN